MLLGRVSRRRCSPRKEAGVEAEKRLEGIVRKHKVLVNETEWSAMVAGRRSYGKCRFTMKHPYFHIAFRVGSYVLLFLLGVLVGSKLTDDFDSFYLRVRNLEEHVVAAQELDAGRVERVREYHRNLASIYYENGIVNSELLQKRWVVPRIVWDDGLPSLKYSLDAPTRNVISRAKAYLDSTEKTTQRGIAVNSEKGNGVTTNSPGR